MTMEGNGEIKVSEENEFLGLIPSNYRPVVAHDNDRGVVEMTFLEAHLFVLHPCISMYRCTIPLRFAERVMEPNFNGGADTNNFVKFDDEIAYPSFVESPSLLNGFQYMENTLDVNFNFNDTMFSPLRLDAANLLPLPSMSSEVALQDGNDSDPLLKYLDQILMEENVDERPSMFLDQSALQAAENTLGQRSPAYVCGNSRECSTSTSYQPPAMFRKDMDETSKLLPSGKQLMIDLNNLPPMSDEIPQNRDITLVEESLTGSCGRKHPHSQELEEQRSSKQPALYVDEDEFSEEFDRVLLFTDEGVNSASCSYNTQPNEASKTSQRKNRRKSGLATRKNSVKNQVEIVDLRLILHSCAISVASDDKNTAYEQLKKIRQHSSSTGDAEQRLAHVFANAIEARLDGTGRQIHYDSLKARTISAAEKLKAYHAYLVACPFKRISMCFANSMILQSASNARTLHIVDFGILYGFQWPILIQQLSSIPGGPLKLRITGIEYPQPGLKPAELVELTGKRLAKYCERFHVPFQYQAIAIQKWEAINIDDLKIVKGEVLAVNSLFRFKNLQDETVLKSNPRGAVLKLIREMNPDIVVTNVVNGCFNAPFFITRFREAFFHYSALFDMLGATLPSQDEHRLNFELQFYGREVMNVISCEDTDRVERPETYKLWDARHTSAGLKPLPLNQELIKKLRRQVKSCYHKDFDLNEEGCWMLQGWKGRMPCASSCWVPK